MAKGKTKLDQGFSIEEREVIRPSARSLAGPKNFALDRKSQEPDSTAYNSTNVSIYPYAKWGKNNKYPQEIVDANVQDTTSAACLNFKIKAHYGKGMYCYTLSVDENGKEVKTPVNLEDPKYHEVRDFLYLSDIENLLQGIIADFEWWNWNVVELIPNSEKGANRKILYASRIPVINTRLELQDAESGKIKHVYVSGEFGGINAPTDPQKIEIIDRRRVLLGKHKITGKSVHVAKQSSVDRQYYPLPMWHSCNKPLNLSLQIFDWILSNINNSANIKYHIQYPNTYFKNLVPRAQYDDDAAWIEDMKKEKELLWKTFDEVLTGTSSAGKYVHTGYDVDPMNGGKQVGFEIKPLENKTNHEAYLPAFDTSAAAIANAHNAPLQLVGLSLSKGFGGGSASDIREAFNFYMQMHTEVPRQTTLEFLYLVKKINGWPEDLHFGYRNIVFQSMNENKSGYSVENEPDPTSANK